MFQLPAWFAGFHCYCTTSQSHIYIFFLTGLPSNFLEATLTLALQHRHAASGQTHAGQRNLSTDTRAESSPPLQRWSLLFLLPHHLWTKQTVHLSPSKLVQTRASVCEPDMFTLKDIVLELCRAKEGLLDCSDLSLVEEPSWGGQSIALSGLKHFLFALNNCLRFPCCATKCFFPWQRL